MRQHPKRKVVYNTPGELPNLSDEQIKHLSDFENYCDACDNFDTPDCPFRDKVNGETKWKVIGCSSFMD